MRTHILILLLLCNSFLSSGQYKIVKEIPTSDTFNVNDDAKSIIFKIYKGKVFEIRKFNSSQSKTDLKILSFDFKTGTLIKIDTILGMPQINISDIGVTDKFIIMTGINRLIYYELADLEKTAYFSPSDLHFVLDTCPYRYCYVLNDSLVLLYSIYNYHPADNAPGCYMKIFNTNTKQIVKEKFMAFKGIATSHVNENWLTVVKKNIYIIDPLTGKLTKYDLSFNFISEVNLKLFSKEELKSNLAYQQSLDSAVAGEIMRISDTVNKNARDTSQSHPRNLQSYIYSKDYIYNTLTTLRTLHTYIGNTFPYDDNLLAITVSRPDYKGNYVDLFFVNPDNGKTIRKYSEWLCHPRDTLNRPEDFFILNLLSDKSFLPYFDHDKIYRGNIYPLSYYENGPIDDVTKNMHKKINKNGYRWSLLEYQLN